MKNKLNFILLFVTSFILLLVTSCKSDELNLSYFNNQQKVILKKILKENDKIFSLKSNLSISDIYFAYIKKLDTSGSPNELLNNLFPRDISYYDSLYKYNIFNLRKDKAFRSQREIIYYNLNMKSNYLLFLKSISKKNKAISKYYNSIISSGGISPSSSKLLLHYLTKEDLKNENIRLILIIHFLLINNF